MDCLKLNKRGSIVNRDNYSFKKYQKELARKKKAEEKKQKKIEKKTLDADIGPEGCSSGQDIRE